MLDKTAHWNDLSDGLREKLEEKISELGRYVKFRFNISNPNPDPEKYNGDVIWPNIYTLKPVTFNVPDKLEDRKGVTKSKVVGMVMTTDADGKPERFKRIQINSIKKGILEFDLGEDLVDEDVKTQIAYLLLHPKLKGGDFSDGSKTPVFELVDLNKEASENRRIRDAKFEALVKAKKLTDEEVRRFASAMVWEDSADILILRDKVEALSQENPDMFEKLEGSEVLEYRSTVKRAMDKMIITWDAIEGKMLWNSNQQVIAVLGQSDSGRSEVERFAEFLMTGGNKATEVYKKIKSLLK